MPVGEDQALARRAHARGGAPLQPPVRPRAGLRGQGRRGAGQAGEGRRALLREAAHATTSETGKRRGAGQGRGAGAQGRGRRSPAGPATTASCCSATSRAPARPSSPSPQALHTEVTKLPGLDGEKMSKSYGNAIAMREEPAEVEQQDPSACPPTRRACAAPTRATPSIARCGSSTRCTPTTPTRDWAWQGLHHRRHRLPRLQAAGDRRDHEASSSRGASAPRRTSRTRSRCTGSSRWAPSARARWRSKTMKDVRDAMGLSY